jgi:hypothetical protein
VLLKIQARAWRNSKDFQSCEVDCKKPFDLSSCLELPASTLSKQP